MTGGENSYRPKILITGINGFVGSHIAELFLNSGYLVTGTVRKTSSREFIEHLNVDLRICDLRDKGAIDDIIRGQDHVVHVAGLIQAKTLDEFMQANRDGTDYTIRSAARCCPNLMKFVYISSQAAVGPSDSMTPIDEETVPCPVSDYGRSKLAGEEVCLKLQGRLPVTILRPPAVYGPRDTGILPFFKLVRSGWFWKLGRKESYASVVHIHDLARAVKLAIESENSTGQTYHVGNQETPSVWQLQKLIAQIMKVEVKPLYTPVGLARLFASLDTLGSVLLNRPPRLTKDKLRELSRRFWICDSTKAEKSLGWRAETALENGLAETIKWYLLNRWL
jgi:nucleoside-diphosphate-sugar epimerase